MILISGKLFRSETIEGVESKVSPSPVFDTTKMFLNALTSESFLKYGTNLLIAQVFS